MVTNLGGIGGHVSVRVRTNPPAHGQAAVLRAATADLARVACHALHSIPASTPCTFLNPRYVRPGSGCHCERGTWK